jgi:uncharacterized protein
MHSPLPATSATQTLDDTEIERLQDLLDGLPPPLQALDVSALDGFLCAVLLQPNANDPARWLPLIFDIEGQALPEQVDTTALRDLIMRRMAHLQWAIGSRQWFDPWVFELAEPAAVGETVLPWVAGFAAAMDWFPQLLGIDDARLLEPLALLYLHFDADEVEEADALQQLIATLEPPQDLGEAVQDIVRSLMLIADVVHPVVSAPARKPPRRAPRPARRR